MTESCLKHLQLLVETSQKADEPTNWENITYQMNALYPECKGTKEKWRSLYRWKFNERFQEQRDQAIQRRDDKRMNRFELEERLLAQLKVKRGMSYLLYKLGETETDILATVTVLQSKGYSIKVWTEDDEVYLQNIPDPHQPGEADHRDRNITRTLKIAIVSDTHMGSKMEALDELEQFYQYVAEEGITAVYHVGDISDGWYTNRPTSIFDQHAVGFQDQLNYIVRSYPKHEGVTTYLITGNHDYTHLRNGGANIGEVLSHYRKDIVYLGHNFARVKLTDFLSLSMIHPTDGSTCALSHRLQRIIDSNQVRRSDIMVVGHYHKTLHMVYKGVHGFLLPSFQHQTPFMADNNLTSDVGGLILTIKLNQLGEMVRMNSEFVLID